MSKILWQNGVSWTCWKKNYLFSLFIHFQSGSLLSKVMYLLLKLFLCCVVATCASFFNRYFNIFSTSGSNACLGEVVLCRRFSLNVSLNLLPREPLLKCGKKQRKLKNRDISWKAAFVTKGFEREKYISNTMARNPLQRTKAEKCLVWIVSRAKREALETSRQPHLTSTSGYCRISPV